MDRTQWSLAPYTEADLESQITNAGKLYGAEGEQVVTRFLEALDHRGTSQPPFLRESGARLIDKRARLGVDHPPVVFSELLA